MLGLLAWRATAASREPGSSSDLASPPARSPLSTQIVPNRRPTAWGLVTTSCAPAGSDMPAGWSTSALANPSGSTSAWRLRPVGFFPASKPWAPVFRGRDRLAVQDCRARLHPPSQRHPQVASQHPGHPLPDAVVVPAPEGGGDRRPRRKLLRHQPSRPTGAQQGADRVEDVAWVTAARVATWTGGRDQRAHRAPPVDGQIGRVRLFWPPPMLRPHPFCKHPLSVSLAREYTANSAFYPCAHDRRLVHCRHVRLYGTRWRQLTMDQALFDQLTRILGVVRTRRAAGALAATALVPWPPALQRESASTPACLRRLVCRRSSEARRRA